MDHVLWANQRVLNVCLPMQNSPLAEACPSPANYTACPSGVPGVCSYSCSIPPAGTIECLSGGRVTKEMYMGNSGLLPDGTPYGDMTSYFVKDVATGVRKACLTTKFTTTSTYDVYSYENSNLWVYIDGTTNDKVVPDSGFIFNQNSPILKCYSRCWDVPTGLPTVYFFVHAYPEAYDKATCVSTGGSPSTSGCPCKATGGCGCQGSIGDWNMTVPECTGKCTAECTGDSIAA